jgi:hypothetical protein
MEESIRNWDAFELVLAEVVSIAGCFCVLSLYEQYRLACKETHFSNLFIPKTVLLQLLAFCIGAVCLFGTQLVTLMGVTYKSSVQVSYRVPSLLAGAAASCVLCSIAMALCSYNSIHVKDELDTVNDFVDQTKTKNIEEIRKLKHIRKKNVFLRVLTSGVWSIVFGGFLVGGAMLLSQYICLYAINYNSVVINWAAVICNAVLCWIYGCVLMWTLFRLLSLFPFDEAYRSYASFGLVTLETSSRLLSVNSLTFTLDDEMITHKMILQEDLEPIILGAVAFAVIGLFFVILADMRMCYVMMNEVIGEADARLNRMMQHAVDATKPQFPDEYAEMRRLDGGSHARKRRTPQKEGPSPAATGCHSNDSSAILHSSPESGRPSHIVLDFADCEDDGSDGEYNTSRSNTGTESYLPATARVSYQQYPYHLPSLPLDCSIQQESSKTVSTVAMSDRTLGFSDKSGFESDRSLRGM